MSKIFEGFVNDFHELAGFREEPVFSVSDGRLETAKVGFFELSYYPGEAPFCIGFQNNDGNGNLSSASTIRIGCIDDDVTTVLGFIAYAKSFCRRW